MIRRRFISVCIALLIALPAVFTGNLASAANIGVAAAVQNEVQGSEGRALKPGSEVFQDETIRTGIKSMTQLIFLDETSLSVGPESEVTLDRFVYNPATGAGDVVLSTAKGAFRFITGSQDPSNYEIKTPFAAIGVRGTIVDCYTASAGTYCTTQEGKVVLTVNGVVYTLLPGQAIFIAAGGVVTGPFTPDGQFFQVTGLVPWPLYGAILPGDEPDTGAPGDVNQRLDELFDQRDICPPDDIYNYCTGIPFCEAFPDECSCEGESCWPNGY